MTCSMPKARRHLRTRCAVLCGTEITGSTPCSRSAVGEDQVELRLEHEVPIERDEARPAPTQAEAEIVEERRRLARCRGEVTAQHDLGTGITHQAIGVEQPGKAAVAAATRRTGLCDRPAEALMTLQG